jgi:4-hydroxybenzoate polyprenyltransferase
MTRGEKEERTMAVLLLVTILAVAWTIGGLLGFALPWPLAGLLAAGAAVVATLWLLRGQADRVDMERARRFRDFPTSTEPPPGCDRKAPPPWWTS